MLAFMQVETILSIQTHHFVITDMHVTMAIEQYKD